MRTGRSRQTATLPSALLAVALLALTVVGYTAESDVPSADASLSSPDAPPSPEPAPLPVSGVVFTGHASALLAGLPGPCPEETSPGPCFWNAHTRAAGRGRSFVVAPDGTITYVPAASLPRTEEATAQTVTGPEAEVLFSAAVAATPRCKPGQVTGCHYPRAVSLTGPSGVMFAEHVGRVFTATTYPSGVGR